MDIEIAGFEIEAEIGRGGFGVVYRARQLAFDRPAAIKVLMANSTPEEIARRFAQECRAVGALRPHRNVVTVYSSGRTADGRPYLAMQYLGGGSLRDRLPLPPDAVVALGITLADGLAAAHAGGVIHRDVKPGNVLFDGDGEPVLVDFGISSLVGDASLGPDDVALSLGYTPPEMFEGGRATASVDVYSLGATLFAALTGRTPFLGTEGHTSIPVLAGRILTQPLEDLRPLGVPEGLCRIVETCMAKDPRARFADMSQLRAALVALQAADTGRLATLLPGTLPGALAGSPRGGAPAAVSQLDQPTTVTSVPPAAAARPYRRRLALAVATVLLLAGGVTAAVAGSSDGARTTPVAGRQSDSVPTGSGARSDGTSAMPGAPTTGRSPESGGVVRTGGDSGDPAMEPDLGGLGPGDVPITTGTSPEGTRPGVPAPVGSRTSTRTTVRTVTAAPPTPTPPAQHAPVLDAVPALSVSEAYVVNTRLSASDADGGKLTYRVTGLPLGVTATADGIISGTVATRASSVTASYTALKSQAFTLRVTVTDTTGRTDTATATWTVRDTRFAMPNYIGFKGCNGVRGCRESVRNVRQLGPHITKCKVVKTNLNRIVSQSVRAGVPVTYGARITYVVGRASC